MMATFLLSYYLHSTVLLAFAWCAMRVVRPRSPIVRERLWKLAAVLPVLMASVWPQVALSLRDRATEASAFRLIDAAKKEVDQQTGDAQVETNVAVIAPREREARGRVYEFQNSPLPIWEVEEPWATNSEIRTPDSVSRAAPHSEVQRSDRESLSEGSSRGAVMATLDWQPFWQIVSRVLCGWMGVGFAWMLVRSVWFHTRLLKARRVDRGQAVELLAKLSRRTPRLLIVPGFTEPAAFGLFRPTIVLPPSCESLPRDELRAVLAHELAHIARGDLWWLLIGRVLTTVLAFQPLNRVARREWTAAAECLCDAWAVDRGVERLTLARCLTALAEHRLTGVSLADALAAVGSPSSLRTRIERLVSEPAVDPWMKPSRRWLLSGSVIAAALLMGVMLPLPTVHSETGIESVPRPLGSGLAEESTGPLPDGRGTDEIVAEIEAELVALRADLARVERFAHESGDAGAIDMVERLRDRERQIIERWERHKLDTADEDKLER